MGNNKTPFLIEHLRWLLLNGLTVKNNHVEKCSYLEFFWSAFFRIRTEYRVRTLTTYYLVEKDYEIYKLSVTRWLNIDHDKWKDQLSRKNNNLQYFQ